MDNEVSQIAYDASVRAIQDQAGVLDSLRTRTGTVLAAAALVSSFLGGQALRESGHLELWSLTTTAVGAFVASAVLALVILWPFEFRFSLSARALIEAVEEHEAKGATSVGELRRVLALQGVRGSYRCSCPRSARVAVGFLEKVMAKPDSGNPTPGWPDLTKPDTRGGGNSGKK